MSARLPVRLLARQVQRGQYASSHAHAQFSLRRPFSSSSSLLDAQNFMMPAMSPTMTEGNIATWKVKEGDSFSSGDVLLEIETDKASMDVEAQEDGVMAKIFVGDNSKAVKVGTRIAVIAEAGDDVSSLTIPEDTSAPVKSAADNVARAVEEQKTSSPEMKGTPENKRPARDRPKTSPVGAGQNPKYPLYPSVQALILQNHISEQDVFKIAATGPGGRLLKGDVLAYLGSIDEEYSKKQSERISTLGHMDLSNIKIAPVQTTTAGAESGAKGVEVPVKGAAAEKEAPKLTSVSLPISLAEVLKVQKRVQDTLGVSVSVSTFLARAVDLANDDLPLPKGTKASSEDLFNAVLGLNTVRTSSRGTYLPQIDALPAGIRGGFGAGSRAGGRPRSNTSAKPDIIDILSGKFTPKSTPTRSSPASASVSASAPAPTSRPTGLATTGGAINVFTLAVPAEEAKRARTFLERMKTVLQVEPGRLVL